MKLTPRRAFAAASVAGLLAIGAVAAPSAFGQDSLPAGDAASPKPPVATSASTTANLEDLYVPVKPCRIADGRQALGVIPAGTTRSYEVRGTTGFVPQGGTSGGCGIPTSATAVTFTITTVTPAGNGFLRAWPEGVSEPNATIMNFVGGQSQTITAPITLGATTAAKDLRVKSYSNSSMLVIEVQGYYAPQIQAHVEIDGSLTIGSPRVLSSSRTGTGVFTVAMDRNVGDCSAAASPDGSGAYIANAFPTGSTVSVYTYSVAGTPSNIRFTLQVSC